MSSPTSNATTVCQVVYDVYLNLQNYASLAKSVQLAMKYRNQGKYYAYTFVNSHNGSHTTMDGCQILKLWQIPNSLPCDPTDENQMYMANCYHNINFFYALWNGFVLANKLHTEVKYYSKSFVIPLSLYPNMGDTPKATVEGCNLIKIMNCAIARNPLSSVGLD